MMKTRRMESTQRLHNTVSDKEKQTKDLDDAQIEVYPTRTNRSPEDAQVAALQEETTRIPILKIAKSEKRLFDTLNARAKVSKNIEESSFSPIVRKHSFNVTWGKTVSCKQRSVDEMLRRTFRKTTTFSSKNITELRQANPPPADLSMTSKRTFHEVLHDRSRSLPRVRASKKDVTADYPIGPLMEHCQYLVESIMKSHNVFSGILI